MLLLSLLCLCTSAQLTVFLSPAGNDVASCGNSWATACRTLNYLNQYVNASVSAIHIADGVYDLLPAQPYHFMYNPNPTSSGLPPFGLGNPNFAIIGVNGSSAVTIDCGGRFGVALESGAPGGGMNFQQLPRARVMGLTFRHCASTGFAGGAMVVLGMDVTINDVVFDSNWGVNGIGAILAQLANITITNCKFINNYVTVGASPNQLGPVVIFSSTINITDSLFYNNTAMTGSSVIISGNAIGTIARCNFSSNVAISLPGAQSTTAFGTLGIAGLAIISVIDSVFENNSAQPGSQGFGGGGALVMFDSASIYATRTIFRGNTATAPSRTVAQGGAAIILSYGSQVFDTCVFDSNTVTAVDATNAFGGAVYIGSFAPPPQGVAPTTIFLDSQIINNQASFQGGAVYASGANSIEFISSYLAGNIAGQDGGVYYGVGVQITSSTFYNNTATAGSGGALVVLPFGTEDTIIQGFSNFSHNTAAQHGGSIYFGVAPQSAFLGIQDCVITNSRALYGGGISFSPGQGGQSSPQISMASTVLDGNIASQSGGAVYINKNLGQITDCSFDNITFSNNVASQEGGGMTLSAGDCVVTQSFFLQNSVDNGNGGAIFANDNTALQAQDCVFTGNSALNGLGGAVAMTNAIYLSLFSNYSDNIANVAGAVVAGGTPPFPMPQPGPDGIGFSFISAGGFYTGNIATSDCGAVLSQNQNRWTSYHDVISGNQALGVNGGGGACVSTQSYANITQSTITGNLALIGGAAGLGISFSAFADITGTTISNNIASATASTAAPGSATTGFGGGVGIVGAGAWFHQECVISGNSAAFGGGIYYIATPDPLNQDYFNYGQSLTIDATTIQNNVASGGGGGIHIAGTTASACSQQPRKCSPYVSSTYLVIHNNTGPIVQSSPGAELVAFASIVMFCNNTAGWAGSNIYHSQFRPAGLDSVLFCGPDYTPNAFGSLSSGGMLYPASPNIPAAVLANINGVGVASIPYLLVASTLSPPPIPSSDSYDITSAPVIYMIDVYGQITDFQAGSSIDLVFFPSANLNAIVASVALNTLKFKGVNGAAILPTITGTPDEVYTLQVHSEQPVGDNSVGNLLPVPNLLLTIKISPCAVGFAIVGRVGCSICPRGSYNTVGGTPCLPCPPGAECNGGSDVHPRDGYWMFSNNGKYYPCPDGFCPGGVCATNQTGVLCSVCTPGNTRWACQCRNCNARTSQNAAAAFWVFAVIVAFGFIHYLVSVDGKGSALLTIGTFFVQTVPLLAGSRCLGNSAARYVTPFLGPFSFNLEVFSGACLNHITYYEKYIVVAISPLILLSIAFIHFGVSRLIHIISGNNSKFHHMPYYRCGISVFKFMYAPVAKQAMEIFACDNSVPGYSLLRADYNVDCNTAQYKQYVGASVILLVLYILPFPFMILYAINRARIGNTRLKENYGFLYWHLKDKLWWYDAVLLYRRSILAALYVLLSYSLNARSLVLNYFLLLLLLIHYYLTPFSDAVARAEYTASSVADKGVMYSLKTDNHFESLCLAMMVFISAAFSSIWLAHSYDLAGLVLALTLPPVILLLYRIFHLSSTRLQNFVVSRKSRASRDDVDLRPIGGSYNANI